MPIFFLYDPHSKIEKCVGDGLNGSEIEEVTYFRHWPRLIKLLIRCARWLPWPISNSSQITSCGGGQDENVPIRGSHESAAQDHAEFAMHKKVELSKAEKSHDNWENL